jgi:hypothetical protein
MWMPVGTQRGIANWSPAGIYMQYAVKTLSDLLHLHCGTTSQIISGLKIASLNSSLLQSWNGPNVAVLHVDD